MTEAHLLALLAAAEAQPRPDGWHDAPEGRHLTLHLSHEGVGLGVSKVVALKSEAGILQARTVQGELFVVALSDIYAGAVESPKEAGRKAGFV